MPDIDGLTVPGIARRAMNVLDEIIRAIRDMNQPVISAINGPAIGGGFCLAVATDIRIAAPSAKFRAAGINNGLTSAELGISYLLPRAIGSSRAFEIMLSGRDVSATEAADCGLVSRIVPEADLLEEVYALADQITKYSRVGVEMTKELLWSSLEASSLQSHMTHEGTAQLYVRLTTENFEEAIKARRDQREPDYRDERHYEFPEGTND